MHCLRLSPHDPFASVFLSLIALAKYHQVTSPRPPNTANAHCRSAGPMLSCAVGRRS
jgi:hypothetical protein